MLPGATPEVLIGPCAGSDRARYAATMTLSANAPNDPRRRVERLRQRLATLRAHAPRALIDSGPMPAVRYTQRAEALGTLFKHLTAGAIWLTAIIVILHELEVAPATVVIGAGFLGVAIALGAQDLLRDSIAGFFILLDDRFGVGNRSQHRGKAVIDVDLPAGLRLAETLDRIAKALHDLHDDPDVGVFVLEEPQILGVETLTRDGQTIRLAVHTAAAKQAEVARAVRARVTHRVRTVNARTRCGSHRRIVSSTRA